MNLPHLQVFSGKKLSIQGDIRIKRQETSRIYLKMMRLSEDGGRVEVKINSKSKMWGSWNLPPSILDFESLR